jgi:hypothetical protein
MHILLLSEHAGEGRQRVMFQKMMKSVGFSKEPLFVWISIMADVFLPLSPVQIIQWGEIPIILI